jgi:polygalacturonase
VLRSVLPAPRSRRVWVAGFGAVGLAAAAAGVVFGLGTAQAAGTFNVRNFGATGNGSTNDGSAIQKAVDAANAAGGGTVQFPPGTYLAGKTIHLHNRITIQVDSGATITGASSGYDAPEPNPNDNFQDFGHSHFHDAMFYGDRLDGVKFVGSGTITGNGHFITGNPSSGQADKLISLTRCTNLTLSGITLARGGHFAALINGCDGVTSDGLTIATGNDRDGWNIINSSNVKITNINDTSNDDALVFKSDWALGKRFTNQGHVTVTNAHLKAGCCNALMFGSETCSDFTDYQFTNITITGASKSGLGMVSMDGAKISNVHYQNITMSGVNSPIMEKIGNRARCGDHPGTGSISNVSYDTITGTSRSFTATIWGNDTSHEPNHVTFKNVSLKEPGGSSSTSTAVPSNNSKDYNPNSIGTRPAYGWYIHNANNISFTGGGVSYANTDHRAAVIANTGSAITFTNFSFEKSAGPNDFVFQGISGYCVTPTGSARISATGSTKSC